MNHIEKIHQGCPNNNHCEKNQERCCYLNKEKKCIINQNKIKGENP